MSKKFNANFIDGLVSSGPAEEYSDKLMLYGQFVGEWYADTTVFKEDGTELHSQWDIRFEWILEGRAIQDLWITPIREDEKIGWHTSGNRYSTTIRTYDPQIDAWHIIWINPPSGSIIKQISRQVGDKIIQVGSVDQNGHLSRWIYSDITPDSFRWYSEISKDQGSTWQLVQEMRAKRK
jgi:hypothetical protein